MRHVAIVLLLIASGCSALVSRRPSPTALATVTRESDVWEHCQPVGPLIAADGVVAALATVSGVLNVIYAIPDPSGRAQRTDAIPAGIASGMLAVAFWTSTAYGAETNRICDDFATQVRLRAERSR